MIKIFIPTLVVVVLFCGAVCADFQQAAGQSDMQYDGYHSFDNNNDTADAQRKII